MDDLTLKQRKWLKLYIELGNATEAAFQAYDCKDRTTAANIGSENVRKLQFEDLMEEAGITDAKLNKKLEEGLNATRTISAIKGTSANGGTTDFIDVPDYATIHKYLETGLKLKKRLIDRKDITSGGDKLEGLVIIKDGSKTQQVADSGVGRSAPVQGDSSGQTGR